MTRDNVLYEYLMSFLGTPYKWGGNNRLSGLDCSGFAIEYLTAAGLWPQGQDTTAQGLLTWATKRGATTPQTPGFGDLLFFGSDHQAITHVGIALTDKLMIEAGGGGSKTLTLGDAATQGAMIRVRPISNRKDLRAVLRVLP